MRSVYLVSSLLTQFNHSAINVLTQSPIHSGTVSHLLSHTESVIYSFKHSSDSFIHYITFSQLINLVLFIYLFMYSFI